MEGGWQHPPYMAVAASSIHGRWVAAPSAPEEHPYMAGERQHLLLLCLFTAQPARVRPLHLRPPARGHAAACIFWIWPQRRRYVVGCTVIGPSVGGAGFKP